MNNNKMLKLVNLNKIFPKLNYKSISLHNNISFGTIHEHVENCKTFLYRLKAVAKATKTCKLN